MIKFRHIWLRIILPAIPISQVLYNIAFPGSRQVYSDIIYIFTVILVCEVSRFVILRSRAWFVSPYQQFKRMLALIPSGILLVTVLLISSRTLRSNLEFDIARIEPEQGITLSFKSDSMQLGIIGSSIFYAFFIFLFLLAIYELAYHFARTRYLEKEKIRLENEKLKVELQQLKGIINPHFLFNNLNSLSALISEQSPLAEEFLDELTKVFRYLLRNNETELITLAQEIQFINSYYQLLKIRHGQGLSMHVNIEPVFESYLLPPLTLQLLVENAVKHNRHHKDYPLTIELFSKAGEKLVVRNNLSLKQLRTDSTGIGLRSINSRYKLLGKQALSVKQDENFFCVVISLIAPGDSVMSISAPDNSDRVAGSN